MSQVVDDIIRGTIDMYDIRSGIYEEADIEYILRIMIQRVMEQLARETVR